VPTHDRYCVTFLQWALPQLRMRWRGFRRVRRQVCRRLAKRLADLGLPDLAAYRAFLLVHPEEWKRVDAACRITISRLYRDRSVFDVLAQEVLPELAAAAQAARSSSRWRASGRPVSTSDYRSRLQPSG